MYYRNELNYTYPDRSDAHMVTLKRTKELKLDENYDYMPRGTWFKIKRAVVAVLLHTVVFPVTHLSHGLKIYGKENLKKHKDELKKEEQKELEKKMLDRESQEDLRKLADEIREKKLKDAAVKIDGSEKAEAEKEKASVKKND